MRINLYKQISVALASILSVLIVTTSAHAAVGVPPIPTEYKYRLELPNTYAWTIGRWCSIWQEGDWQGYDPGCVNKKNPFPWSTPSLLAPKAMVFDNDRDGEYYGVSAYMQGWLEPGETLYHQAYDYSPNYDRGVEILNFNQIKVTQNTGNVIYHLARRYRELECPRGYEPIGSQCELKGANLNKCNSGCKVGNPIHVRLGTKLQKEQDIQFTSSGLLGFIRYYTSADQWEEGVLGTNWRHTYSKKIKYYQVDGSELAVVYRANGNRYNFVPSGNAWISDGDVADRLVAERDAGSNIIGWTYTTASNITEHFDVSGKLIEISNIQGDSINLSYSNDKLDTVIDNHGQTLTFGYTSAGQLQSITDTGGNKYTYAYASNGNLTSVTYPDDTTLNSTDNPTRIYLYEDTRYSRALTGIVDENGNRAATWSYDDQGRAVSSEHANSTDRYTLTFNSDGTTTVTNPLGKQSTYHFDLIQGVYKVTQVEGHPTTYCAGANKAYSYDANGNIISKTDWNGVETTYTYDMDRNLELSRTEAVGTPQERTIVTEWHPQFRLPTKIIEPGRIIEYTYDAQGRRLSSKTSSVQ